MKARYTPLCILFMVLLLCTWTQGFSQATFISGASAAQIANALTSGSSDLTITNTTITVGGASQFGLFTNGIAGANLGIDSSVILTTSSVAESFTSNSSPSISLGGFTPFADPDLTAIDPNAVFDVAIIEFDLRVSGAAKGIQIRYQFGSDEYPAYVCSRFNDVFGFFISGGSIPGVQNIATVPTSGLPVAVNNVNVGVPGIAQDGTPCDLGQSALFIDNGNGGRSWRQV